MKRIFAGVLTVFCLLGCVAQAEARFEVSGARFYVVPRSDYYRAEVFAQVTNTGDGPATLDDVTFRVSDASGEAIDADSSAKLWPSLLAPGESGYLTVTLDDKQAESADAISASYTLEVGAKVKDSKVNVPLDADVRYADGELIVIVTNSTDAPAEGVTCVAALRAKDGDVLCVAGAKLRSFSLLPGSAVQATFEVDDDVMEAIGDALNEAQPDAMAWIQVDAEDD